MRIRPSLLRLALAAAGLLVCGIGISGQTARIFLDNGSVLTNQTASLKGKLPVLFIHGHNPDAGDSPPNYQNNWQSPLRDLPSFQQTLALNLPPGQTPQKDILGIEPYYIKFSSQRHSISNDAEEISDAIDLILHRHDPSYNYPASSTQRTVVKVVIVAYSKGTISARLYLKNILTDRPGFQPVSEFIAIAPPNHGTNLEVGGASCASQQLMNGKKADCSSFNINFCALESASSANFIRTLNDPDEAPGSRTNTNQNGKPNPPTAGTLYVTIFANGERDFVGGKAVSTDCDGRRRAENLSPNSIDIDLSEITNEGWQSVSNPNNPITGQPLFTQDEVQSIAVHQNTVHTPLVICKALYAAVHHRSPEGQDCSLSNAVDPPIIPPPARAAAMLTLDFSGSMRTLTPPSNLSRAVILKDSVDLFIKLWLAVGVPSDRLGVTYFRTNVDEKEFGGERLPLLSLHGNDVNADVGMQTPNNDTAMGGGLQRSIEALNGVAADTPIRRVILFTDGIQNVNPMVVWNQASQLVIDANPPIVLNSSLGAVNPGDPAIVIDTIGIGSSGDFVTRLADIAHQTNGFPRTTVQASLLREFFVEALINALKGFSPQLVAYRRGAVNAGGGAETFAIENGVRKLVLKVSWQRGQTLDFTVARNGVDVTSAGRFINGDFYKIFVVDLPTKDRIEAGGNWQVRINGPAGTSYEAAAIVDGSAISYDSNFDLKQPKAGEPLELVVRLAANSQPITGARVNVTLWSPTVTAGDIIFKNPPKDLPAFEPGLSIGERQLLALAQDPKRSAALKPASQKLELTPAGNGEFRARLNTKVPGVYTAFVTIEGSNPQLGQFSRTMTMTSVVRFANADPRATDIDLSECDAASGRRYVRLYLLPRDSNGHFMGPGSPSEIALELSAGRVVGRPRDLGDGSYALWFEVPTGSDPTVTLKVAGNALFSERLSQLSAKYRR